MIYIKTFKNYEEFKDIFSVRECGNGSKQRHNKILLSCLKDRKFIHSLYNDKDYAPLVDPFWNTKSVADLIALGKMFLCTRRMNQTTERRLINLVNWQMYSSVYYIDGYKGLCVDGSTSHIRYTRFDNGKVFKMKAGKFLHNIMQEYVYLPLSWQRILEETFASEWVSYAKSCIDDITLVVDDDFASIYNSDICIGNFKSCMVDDGQHYFYRDAVKAKAASIRNKDGEILARCIVFTEVMDKDTGEVFRLAERQYSKDGDLSLQRLLVDKLVKGGHIDGYKQIGVDCHSADSFVDLNEDSMSDRTLSVECNLDFGDTLSYQDSFKWYDYHRNMAYNKSGHGSYQLDETDSTFEDPDARVYSNFHDCYIPDDEAVYVDSRSDYFYQSECVEYRYEWYYEDDCVKCDECNTYIPREHAWYSEITEEWYCDEDCLSYAEDSYKRSHWHFSDYDEEYYENESDITTYNKYSSSRGKYFEETISRDSLYDLIDRGWMFEYNGEYYDEIDEDTGLPYGVDSESESDAA